MLWLENLADNVKVCRHAGRLQYTNRSPPTPSKSDVVPRFQAVFNLATNDDATTHPCTKLTRMY